VQEQRPPAQQQRPPVRIEIVGPVPYEDELWCFTCAAQYMGTLTESQEWQEAVEESRKKAEAKGESVVHIRVPDPSITGGRLNIAVTWGTSIWAPGGITPVCWSHIQGIKPDEKLYAEMAERRRQMAATAGLIPGKRFEVPGR
jgi:hypothetical protein